MPDHVPMRTAIALELLGKIRAAERFFLNSGLW